MAFWDTVGHGAVMCLTLHLIPQGIYKDSFHTNLHFYISTKRGGQKPKLCVTQILIAALPTSHWYSHPL